MYVGTLEHPIEERKTRALGEKQCYISRHQKKPLISDILLEGVYERW